MFNELCVRIIQSEGGEILKRVLKYFMIVGVMLLVLTGCTTNKSFTFNVETGDKVKVQLNTTDGYDLSSDLPFTISKDDNKLSQATFIKGTYYTEYVEVAKNDPLAEIIDKGSTNEIEYVFYSYNDSEYNYIIKINESNTAILLTNQNSQEEAEKCFELLTFTLEN